MNYITSSNALTFLFYWFISGSQHLLGCMVEVEQVVGNHGHGADALLNYRIIA